MAPNEPLRDAPVRPMRSPLASAAILLGIYLTMVRAVVASLCRVAVRIRRRWQARVFRTELRHLDDRMLHDLGIDRSEIDSVAGEIAGLTEATRLRALLSTQLFP